MSVYRVIDVVGTSTTSWEEAAADAIKTAGHSVRDLRVAEVVKQDIHVGDGGELVYRTKIQLSFKYESIVGRVRRRWGSVGSQQHQPLCVVAHR